MFVVGTAGHVDHGKSTLVKALTGIDPDRLREEKARGMTIDLGFAWLTLPSGREVSIVDVPGHERFIKNMLAGVGGIDVALLVVAADEGPMPQTAEHLAILDLLGVARGLVVLTKRDLVDDDWLDLVREEVARAPGRHHAGGRADRRLSPPTTGAGLDDLRAALDRLLDEHARARRDIGAPAPADRPRLHHRRLRHRRHRHAAATARCSRAGGRDPARRAARSDSRPAEPPSKVERAQPGSRVAVNLAGLAVEDLRRGDVLTLPGALPVTDRLDVRLTLTADAPVELEQNDEVDFFLGADELPARLTLLDQAKLRPGDSAWAQARLARPIAALKGDRFIIRRPRPASRSAAARSWTRRRAATSVSTRRPWPC